MGKTTVRLLRLIDSKLSLPSQLRNLLLDLRTPTELLLDQDSRIHLLELLRPDELEALRQYLELNRDTLEYDTLSELKIRSGSTIEARLLSFFGLAAPDRQIQPLESVLTANCQYPLFEHQRRAASDVALLLSKPPFRALLHMPTGAGKTRTTMNIICDFLRTSEPTLVVWLAYSEELCTQAVQEFEKAWSSLGNRQLSVNRYWGSHDIEFDSLRDGIVIAGLGKLYHRAKRSIEFIATLADRTGLVIIDEAHQAVAESYSLILNVLSNKKVGTKLLGLSATPGRTWNDLTKDAELANFFAGNKATLRVAGYTNPLNFLTDQGYLARPTFVQLKCHGHDLTQKELLELEAGFDIPKSVIKRLAEDEVRNLLIVKQVEELVRHHRRILVFAATVEHARVISTVLRARGICSDSVTGTTEAVERERIIRQFRSPEDGTKVLCNYGVLTAGFDAPRTSAALITRPTRSLVLYSQMVGRATRGERAGGNKRAEIRTIVDTNLPGFGDLAEAFFNWEDVWL